MPKLFWILFGTFAFCWYFMGYIGWRVQNDALRRGYGRAAANFWGIGIIFLPFIFLPLYIVFRYRAPGYVTEEIRPGQRTLCPHCGEVNPKDAELCRHCGKRMEIEIPEIGLKQCPNCGHMNPVTAEYCTKCDERISFKE
jgi:ribosomal protein L40E